MAAPRALTIYPTASAALSAIGPTQTRAMSAGLAWSPVRHALSRFGYGPTPTDLSRSFDPDLWWQQQIAAPVGVASYDAVPGVLSASPCVAMGTNQTYSWLQANFSNTGSYEAMNQLGRATMLLQAFSPNQLFESVCEFFSNHLNVINGQANMAVIRPTFDRDVIRSNAFGRFADMLLASSRDKAMATYLTLTQSSGTNLNENYGRELLELHTVTPAAGYTQADVVDSARILTGRGQKLTGEYQFYGNLHYYGPVKVLEFSSENSKTMDGSDVGDAYLDYLAHHPMTAANLARKLCVRYVSDSPSADLVSAVAQAYLTNDTAILPMLSVIFRSSEFWLARGLKWRRPIDNLLASVRILGVGVASDIKATGAALVSAAAVGGQPSMGWPAPNGYPDAAGAWQSATTILQAWNNQVAVLTGAWSSALTAPRSSDITGGVQFKNAGSAVDAVASRLLGTPLQPGQRAAVLAYFGDKANTSAGSSRAASDLPNLAALILHTPQHAAR